ncbi:MAG: energy-coupling factor transporter transmembrane protein EcfT [Lachnospiraceae bacterium]|nr:energy-coupling factor transporter transmembrane protein EcfT [Lachnospiraceae bacterium]
MIKDITIGQYYNSNSILHRLDPRVKLVGTFVFLIALFVANNIVGYIVATIYLIFIIKSSKVPFKYIVRGLKSLFFLLSISIVLNLFFTPGRVLFKFYFVELTYEGLIIAVKMATRLIYLVIGSSILTLTTTPSKLTDGLEKGLSFLNVFKVPIAEIALMISISLRFIPILIDETDKIMKAQTSRGADFESGNLIEKAKALIPLLIPLFISAFRRANDLALAMESRCYSSLNVRTKLKPLNYDNKDKLGYLVLLIFMLLIIFTRYIKINVVKF